MPAGSGLDGILVIDKPARWTSHDVVAKARRLTGQRRIGHTGTLDPMATGVLVLCLGQATRLVEYMTAHDKRYVGEVMLGRSTTTDDAEGSTLSEHPVPPVHPDALLRIEGQFTGEIWQRPPSFSAIKVEGRRAYAKARAGEVLDLPARRVVIHDLHIDDLGDGRLGVAVHCGPGTYIRSLARDIGELLGCGAHLSKLRRVAVGEIGIEQAITLEELAARAHARDELLLPLDEGIAGFDAAILGPSRADDIRFGRVLAPVQQPSRPSSALRLYDAEGEFVGVGSVDENGQIRGSKVMKSVKLPSSN